MSKESTKTRTILLGVGGGFIALCLCACVCLFALSKFVESDMFIQATGTPSILARATDTPRFIAEVTETKVTNIPTATSKPSETPTITQTKTKTATPTPTNISTGVYTGQWALVGSMANARGYHTATVLRDGRVLIVGGYTALDRDTASVEIFDPTTNTFSPTGSLNIARHGHSATLLPDGRVLVIAGYGGTWLSNAEIYDPTTGRWSIIQPIFPHGVSHTATVLKDGRVLVMAGAIRSGFADPDDRVEIFDPKTNRWQKSALHMNTQGSHTATLLTDGRVLISGGMTDPSIYDPGHDTWQPVGKPSVNRAFAQAVLLQDGRVLIMGGFILPQGETILNSVEVYNPVNNVWQQVASLSQPRYFHTATLLSDGRVLVVGGWKSYNGYEKSLLNTAEIYDYKSATWSTLAPLKVGRVGHTTTLLPDGRILVTGGETNRGVLLNSAEVLGK